MIWATWTLLQNIEQDSYICRSIIKFYSILESGEENTLILQISVSAFKLKVSGSKYTIQRDRRYWDILFLLICELLLSSNQNVCLNLLLPNH